MFAEPALIRSATGSLLSVELSCLTNVIFATLPTGGAVISFVFAASRYIWNLTGRTLLILNTCRSGAKAFPWSLFGAVSGGSTSPL